MWGYPDERLYILGVPSLFLVRQTLSIQVHRQPALPNLPHLLACMPTCLGFSRANDRCSGETDIHCRGEGRILKVSSCLYLPFICPVPMWPHTCREAFLRMCRIHVMRGQSLHSSLQESAFRDLAMSARKNASTRLAVAFGRPSSTIVLFGKM